MKKSRHAGSTLPGMLVAIAVLAMILVLTLGILDTGRRSYSSARENATQAGARDSALSSLGSALDSITFTQHPVFSADGTRLELESDQHFVCGPAAGLLPDVPGLSGDAVFFQKQNGQGTTEAAGFLVHYGDDSPWQPQAIPNLKPQRRFRLLQFHQTTGALSLYQTPASTGIPTASGSTGRPGVHQWFARPLSHLTARNCRIIADNILTMLIDPEPGGEAVRDPRRPEWDTAQAAGPLMKNRLPRALVFHLLIGSDAGWKRLDATRNQALAEAILNQANLDRASLHRPPAGILQGLTELLKSEGIGCQVVSIRIPLPGEN